MGTAHKDLAADVVQSKPLVEPGHEFLAWVPATSSLKLIKLGTTIKPNVRATRSSFKNFYLNAIWLHKMSEK